MSSALTWNPTCEIFEHPDYDNDYKFVFEVADSRCFNKIEKDLITVEMNIKDVEKEDEDFLPPNFISPNGDGLNEYFAMIKVNDNGEVVSILPKDNCEGTFVNITIFNRWGSQVYESSNRDFKWNASDVSSGVYFYNLKFSNTEYRGTISVATGN